MVVVFFWLVWPVISRWLKKKAMERAEDYFRKSMGIPPRDRKKRKSNKSGEEKEEYYRQRGKSGYKTTNSFQGPIIPKEYAVDVEFTETLDYSEKETIDKNSRKEVYKESQVSDVEFIEIKEDRNK